MYEAEHELSLVVNCAYRCFFTGLSAAELRPSAYDALWRKMPSDVVGTRHDGTGCRSATSGGRLHLRGRLSCYGLRNALLSASLTC